jgi:hypothetical protein
LLPCHGLIKHLNSQAFLLLVKGAAEGSLRSEHLLLVQFGKEQPFPVNLLLASTYVREGRGMDKIFIDITELQTLIFERNQILALLEDTELWQQIPLSQRFAIVDSSEFIVLMGASYTADVRRQLEDEVEAMTATIH